MAEPKHVAHDPSDVVADDSAIFIGDPGYYNPMREYHWSDDARLRLTGSIPEGNWFYFNHSEKRINTAGFLGLIIGAEYFPNKKYFYSAKFGVVADIFLPFPAPIDYCVCEGVYTTLFQLQYNRNFPKYSVGAGLHWLLFDYRQYYADSLFCGDDVPEIQEFDIHGKSLGLSFSAQRRFSSDLYIELNYVPTILLRENGRFNWKYSHTVYLGFTAKRTIWKF